MKLRTALLPHQVAAVDKMIPLRVGALFMEMGTGKSRVGIEIAVHRFNAGKISKVVWFCPVSTKETIAAEIRKHVEDPRVYKFDDKTEEGKIPQVDFYIVGLESMSASARLILAAAELMSEKTMVILDESSYIKNSAARRTKWISTISGVSRYRMIFTGTPISQGIVDLYSQMKFLDARILGFPSFHSFAREHLVYSTKRPGMIVDVVGVNKITAKIAPYTYQITKRECLNLPEKLYDKVYFSLSPEQNEAYQSVKDDFCSALDDLDQEFCDDQGTDNSRTYRHDRLISIEIFRMFSRLQSVVCGWFDGEKLKHNRTQLLRDLLLKIPRNEKVIIWTNLRSTIPEIREVAEEFGLVAEFHGGMNERNKDKQLDAFHAGNRFLVATSQSGGHGLTLNEAAYVVFYNNEFKYSNRAQAEDRNHRVGQTKRVTYVDIAASNTIDEVILGALEKKQNVAYRFREMVRKIKDKDTRKEALTDLLNN